MYFEVYQAHHTNNKWRWVMWRKWSEAANAILCSIDGPGAETREACVADLNAFKKLVATSPTRS